MMGCGDTGGDLDCADALERVYLFLDGEIRESDAVEAKRHLVECTPCLREYGLEEEIKRLVHRSCRSEEVPAGLRERVMVRIEQITVELRSS
jgi:anti-sigma factor (TIGR02949 family)